MADQDQPGPDQGGRFPAIPDPDQDDLEGQGYRGIEPVPAKDDGLGPDDAARRTAVPVEDDVEGQGFKGI